MDGNWMRNTKDHGTHMLSIAVGSFAKGRRAVGMRRRLQGRLPTSSPSLSAKTCPSSAFQDPVTLGSLHVVIYGELRRVHSSELYCSV